MGILWTLNPYLQDSLQPGTPAPLGTPQGWSLPSPHVKALKASWGTLGREFHGCLGLEGQQGFWVGSPLHLQTLSSVRGGDTVWGSLDPAL